jgi:D-methionine transport system ATP-binding protein
MITLKGLTKAYQGRPVLRGINLSIQAGEIFGIIGKSGAGKSTLLRCINLLECPDSGEVWVDQRNLLTLSPHDLHAARHQIGMIFQHFNLLEEKTVFENIALPMRIQGLDKATIQHKVPELLELIDLTHKQHAYPAQLSGGEKQRVAIARALSCSPKVLLCDEATSALDPETTASILALMKKINQLYGITLVLITHEMEVIKDICHQVAVIEDGLLIENMPLRDVFTHKDSIARRLLYAQLSPKLPIYLTERLTSVANHRPLLRLFFEGQAATGPFISQASRLLNLDMTILLANLDCIESITCGVLIIELHADTELLHAFLTHCQHNNLTVETLGYVSDPV